jgi:hypothetical protein
MRCRVAVSYPGYDGYFVGQWWESVTEAAADGWHIIEVYLWKEFYAGKLRTYPDRVAIQVEDDGEIHILDLTPAHIPGFYDLSSTEASTFIHCPGVN